MFRKQIATLSVVLFALNLMAAEQNAWHAPEMAQQLQSKLWQQVNGQNQGIGASAISGAKKGLAAPWVVSFFAGMIIGGCHKNVKRGDRLLGGMATFALLSPLNIAASLPAAAIGGGIGLSKGIVHGIKSKINEPGLKQEVAHHLYKWINAVVEGRAAVRSQISDWQASHDSSSIKDALKDMLSQESFKAYVSETHLSESEIEHLLVTIQPDQDNWREFFGALSDQAKLSWMTEQQYQTVKKMLVKWINKEGFPAVTEEQIENHFIMAIYFFNATNPGTCQQIIKTFIGERQ